MSFTDSPHPLVVCATAKKAASGAMIAAGSQEASSMVRTRWPQTGPALRQMQA
jgi:hypothetical protein